MPTVKLSIEVPGDTWIGAISSAHDDAVFRVLTALVSDETGFGVLELETERPLEILAEMKAADTLKRVDLVSAGEDRAVVHIETADISLLEPLTTAGIPLETPIRIEDGTVVWEFRSPEDRLSSLDDQLRAAGLSYEVEHVRYDDGDGARSGPTLTDRQEEVFTAAYRLGFFEIPRDATVATVAAEAGVSKSTASDVLRRAIRNLAEWYVPQASHSTGS